ncbi:MAG: hypothetical protein P8Y44_11750 [Acidobacteriota bacterium]
MRATNRLESIAALFFPRSSQPEGAASLLRSDHYVAARSLIQAFYAILFFLALGSLYSWPGYLEAIDLTPRWPILWLRFVDQELGIALILCLHLLGGLAGLAYCKYRWARVLAFVSLLEFLAFKFSFGSINHGDHLGLLLSFTLIFLPAGWSDSPRPGRKAVAATLLVFSASQGMMLLTYSMSGLWKLFAVISQTLQGQVSAIAPTALARHVAAKLLSSDTTSLLGPWLIEHYWVGWPLMIATLYLELFALWATARVSLHRWFGLGLILLHVSTHLTLNVSFVQNSLWLALFLVFSPFNPDRPDRRSSARDLPLLGRIWSR